MNRTALSAGMAVSLAFFAVGVALAATGLGTEYWMTSKMSIVDARVGLFHICVEYLLRTQCVSTLDLEIGYSDSVVPEAAETTDFLVCQICIIAGVALGATAILACVFFFFYNIIGNNMSKGPFIAIMISSISSVICIACGVLAFGILIHNESDGFKLDYSFILTCVAMCAILIGCFVFGVAARPFLNAPRGGIAHTGTVFSVDPLMAQQLPPPQYGVPQQPGLQYGYTQTPKTF